MTIFEKIIARQIPAKIIWEDDDAIAFHDVDPQAPVHVLIVPKKAVPRLADAPDADAALLGKLLLVARDVAKKLVGDAQDLADHLRSHEGSALSAEIAALRERI